MHTIVFLGAGSVEFTRQLLADLFRFEDLPPLRIALYDINAERLQVAQATAEQLAARFARPVEILATVNRREALQGADFVINSILVGGAASARKDLEIPAAAGLLQNVGDTTGIGGVFRGLRTFPVLTEIANDMLDVCPDAWFLNYTNPMSMNVWWMSAIAPSIKTVGLCHSVYWTVHDLCELVGADVERTRFRAAGVNHQSWLLEWSEDGNDLYPRLQDAIAADPELSRRVRVEIFKRVSFYPTETSEHSAEYLPWFLRSPEQIERFRLEPLGHIAKDSRNLAEFENTKATLAAGEPLPLLDEAAEYAPQVIHSIITGTEREIHANVVNNDFIAELPNGAVVEVPARVDGSGVHPLAFGPIPGVGAALNRTYLAVADLTIQAALTGNPELVRQAVLLDPNASSSVTPETIWALCDELTQAHADLLPRALGGNLAENHR